MSYTRWGAPIGVDLQAATARDAPTAAFIAWHNQSVEEQIAEAERQGGTTSRWYIYWDASSDDELGRNGQLLAVWYAGHHDMPLIDYRELRNITDRTAWHLLPGFNPQDHPLDVQNVKDCILAWLDEVEEEFPEAPALTRLELATHWRDRAQVHDGLSRDTADDDSSQRFSHAMTALCAASRTREIAQRAQADQDPAAEHIARMAVAIRAATNQNWGTK